LLFFTLITGFVLLIAGGELLVRGGVRLARIMGVPPLIIGITIVGFGTSTPELVAAIQAVLAGVPQLAIGNIVGSNIANLLLILGVAALLSPISVTPETVRRDGALVVATAVLLLVAGFMGGLTRPIGIAFIVALVAYMYFLLRHGRVPEEMLPDSVETPRGPWELATSGVLALIGIGLVITGGKLLVDGAVELARLLDVSEQVIGLTVVAVGTSLPELATTLMAVLRKSPDIALGNVLGSNVYNVLGIGGITATVRPLPISEQMLRFDLPFMVALSILLVVLALRYERLGRATGVLFLTTYAAYVASLFG
jgi:cation:H+ antiporter